mmetsp:Transcript_17036/g.32242  ORF Transcript_17036/g.32242 Transcript_17036/m.32242 type:complete len:188 (-) Transcript_17036:1274-1837(-)
MKIASISLLLLTAGIASAFSPHPHHHHHQNTIIHGRNSKKKSSLFPLPRQRANIKNGLESTASVSFNTNKSVEESNDAPELTVTPPRKICLMVEPTPFTHVSGYSNRFNEMLRYLSKANDHVDILTVDAKTPEEELPKEKFGYKIEHTQGFTFPLYNHISLTCDLPEMKGANIIEKLKPDLIHASSP